MRRFLFNVVPILAYAGLIYLLSAQSKLPGPDVRGLDKVAHFLEYAVLALLVARALASFRISGGWSVGIAILLCAIYGLSDEIHQMYTPHRVPDYADWVADVLGASTGAFTWLAYRRTFSQLKAGDG